MIRKDRPASLFIHIQPFLVQMKNSLVLFDTGLGYSNDKGQLFLHEHIKKAGFDPDDIDMVLMSHLHFDHSGGMIHHVGQSNGTEFSACQLCNSARGMGECLYQYIFFL